MHHFRVHELLSKAELAALEDFAREPACTVDECFEWMQVRGFTLARSSVGSWLRNFKRSAMFRTSSETAHLILELAKKEGVAFGDAVSISLNTAIFDQLNDGMIAGTLDEKKLHALASAHRDVMASKMTVEDLKIKQNEALIEAEKIQKAGGSAQDVVAKVRGILGIQNSSLPFAEKKEVAA
jgi:hypothetical protein